MVMQKYQGSCHCGAIHFSFEAEPITKGIRCNCSYCSKRALRGQHHNIFWTNRGSIFSARIK